MSIQSGGFLGVLGSSRGLTNGASLWGRRPVPFTGEEGRWVGTVAVVAISSSSVAKETSWVDGGSIMCASPVSARRQDVSVGSEHKNVTPRRSGIKLSIPEQEPHVCTVQVSARKSSNKCELRFHVVDSVVIVDSERYCRANGEGEGNINMGTFSKAYGGQGAYVSSKKEIIDYLINKCRSLIYTTSLPPSLIAGNIRAVQIGEKDRFRRQKVEENSRYLREKLIKKGYSIGESTSQIIPIILKSNNEAVEKSRELFAKGIILPAIRKPTVIEPRLRISLGYLIEKEDMDKLLELL